MTYCNDVLEYIQMSTSTKDKIDKINAIIDVLYDSMLAGALKEGIEEYRLDDGQTTIKTVFRSVTSINTAIDGLERQRNRLIAQTTGRETRLRDGNVKYCGL